MTFKGFMIGAAYIPASVLSGLANLTLGSTKLDPKGEPVLDEKGEPVVTRGLLGLLFDGVQYIGRSIADLIANHTTAITIAFWTSLALSGAAALTVFLWPAALTAVTTFSIYGYSIAGMVGTDALLQVGAVAGLTFGATSVATYLTAAVVNTVMAFIDLWKGPEKKGGTPPPKVHEHDESVGDVLHNHSHSQLSRLFPPPKGESPVSVKDKESPLEPPVHHAPPLPSDDVPPLVKPAPTPVEEAEHLASAAP